MQYKILYASTTDSIEYQMANAIREGWLPQGGLCNAYGHTWAQAIVRHKKPQPAQETAAVPCPDCGHYDKTHCLHEPGWKPATSVTTWRCTICNNVNPDDATHCRQCEYSRTVMRDGKRVPREGRL